MVLVVCQLQSQQITCVYKSRFHLIQMCVVVFRGVCEFVFNGLTAESQDRVAGQRCNDDDTVLFMNLDSVDTFKQSFGNDDAFFCNSSLHFYSILYRQSEMRSLTLYKVGSKSISSVSLSTTPSLPSGSA